MCIRDRGNALYQSSLEKGGDFANNVISNIAQGNYGQVGSITGEGAEAAFQSYMGISADNKANHSYTNVEIGGGRITGVETTPDGTSRESVSYTHLISEPVYQEPCYDEFNPEFLSEDSEDNFPDSEMVPLDKKSIMS